MSILLVLTDLPQATANQHSLRMNAGDCVFALAKRRRLLRQVPPQEDYERAWEAACRRVAQGLEPGFTSVLAVHAQDRLAGQLLRLDAGA